MQTLIFRLKIEICSRLQTTHAHTPARARTHTKKEKKEKNKKFPKKLNYPFEYTSRYG